MNNYIVGFPKSGNTWIRLFFEYYTKKSSDSLGEEKPILYHTKDRCITKVHWFDDPRFQVSDKYKVLFLLRDTRNCLASFFKWRSFKYDNADVLRTYIFRYLYNIECFTRYKGDKIVIYYEDLVDNFEKAIIPAIELFGLEVDEEKIKKFSERNQDNFYKVHDYFEETEKRPINHDMNFGTRWKAFPPEQLTIINYMVSNIFEKYVLHATCPVLGCSRMQKNPFQPKPHCLKEYMITRDIIPILSRYTKAQYLNDALMIGHADDTP